MIKMKIKPYTLLYNNEKDLTISRRYQEFSTTNEMAKHIIDTYEDVLRQSMMDETDELEYGCKDLFHFLNTQVTELVCLRLVDNNDDLWEPLPKDWVYERVYNHLRDLGLGKNPDQEMEICLPD